MADWALATELFPLSVPPCERTSRRIKAIYLLLAVRLRLAAIPNADVLWVNAIL